MGQIEGQTWKKGEKEGWENVRIYDGIGGSCRQLGLSQGGVESVAFLGTKKKMVKRRTFLKNPLIICAKWENLWKEEKKARQMLK